MKGYFSVTTRPLYLDFLMQRHLVPDPRPYRSTRYSRKTPVQRPLFRDNRGKVKPVWILTKQEMTGWRWHHNTAQNRPDNFPSYSPDNHHCSDDVYLREGGDHSLTLTFVYLVESALVPLRSLPNDSNPFKLQLCKEIPELLWHSATFKYSFQERPSRRAATQQ